MIAFLDGILAEKQPTSVVINVHGVGYAVLIPLSTYDRLPATGQPCRLFTYHHIREDGQTLCGFAEPQEKRMFELLLGVSGIGPKLALGALSGMSLAELRLAIAGGDTKRISSIHGIGKKTAERIVLELRDKMDPADALASHLKTPGTTENTAILRDTVLALTALGFPQDTARKMVQTALDAGADVTDTEVLLKRSLASR